MAYSYAQHYGYVYSIALFILVAAGIQLQSYQFYHVSLMFHFLIVLQWLLYVVIFLFYEVK